jgi:predicted O-methyltransferase YrrM
MARRVPKNLELLRAAFDPKRIGDILPGDEFDIDGVEFVCAYDDASTAERFYIVKSPELVARYRVLCNEVRGGRIFELGIAEGGSTALMALDATPAKLVAIDLEEQPLPALDELIAARGLDESVRPHWGVDQSDHELLAKIVDDEFGGEALDVVIDDCSHQLLPTRRSFEALFPRLRPGGRYIIEDWNADHLMREAVVAALRQSIAEGDDELRESIRESIRNLHDQSAPRRSPLSQLAIEALLWRANGSDAIAAVTVDDLWVTITRGPGELDPIGFRLDEAYVDHFGLKGW